MQAGDSLRNVLRVVSDVLRIVWDDLGVVSVLWLEENGAASSWVALCN